MSAKIAHVCILIYDIDALYINMIFLLRVCVDIWDYYKECGFCVFRSHVKESNIPSKASSRLLVCLEIKLCKALMHK